MNPPPASKLLEMMATKAQHTHAVLTRISTSGRTFPRYFVWKPKSFWGGRESKQGFFMAGDLGGLRSRNGFRLLFGRVLRF